MGGSLEQAAGLSSVLHICFWWNLCLATSLGHVVPEAQVGGPIALVEDGDRIVVDAEAKTIEWMVDDATQKQRRDAWEKKGRPSLKVKRGVLFRYARDVAVRSQINNL